MRNDQIIRSWKDKKFSASLGKLGHVAPANPAGYSTVSMKDLEMSEFISTPASPCSLTDHCLCG